MGDIRRFRGIAIATLLTLGVPVAGLAQDSNLTEAQKVLRAITTTTGAQADPSAGGVTAAPGGPAEALHVDAPSRNPGWWEFTAETDSGQTMGSEHLCTGPLSEARYSAFDQILEAMSMGSRMCAKHDFLQDQGGWSFDLACDTGLPVALVGGPSTSTGTITGDIRSDYVVHLTLAMAGQTNSGSIRAAWKGDCPADRKEGDRVVAGDTVINVLE
jgi:hypothetical protein